MFRNPCWQDGLASEHVHKVKQQDPAQPCHRAPPISLREVQGLGFGGLGGVGGFWGFGGRVPLSPKPETLNP